MRRPENDVLLPQLIRDVQKLAASLDQVARERGLRGIEEVAADITAANRKVEWRCQELHEPWWRNTWLTRLTGLKTNP